MGSQDELRAADADRERVAEQLREAASEGRLDLTEYDDRVARAYAAKTYGELDQLLADLPKQVPAQRQSYQPAPARESGAVRGWLVAVWQPWAGVVSICVAIWLVSAIASTSVPYFWPVWVAGPWGAVLLFRTFGGLTSGEPQRRAAERAKRAVAGNSEGPDRPATQPGGG